MSKARPYAELNGQRPKQSWDYDSLSARQREGLTSRSTTPSHEVQLRVDPIHGEFDEELDGLRSKVAVLKGVAQEIESETRFQNELLNQLEASMSKAQAGISNTMKRLNRSLAVRGSSHLTHVILFALLCCLGIYFWARFFR